MEKTHWKKATNPDYLGAWDWKIGEGDKVVTIDKVVQKTVIGDGGKKSERPVAILKGGLKPLVLNATNCKTLIKLADSKYLEDWAGKTISLYVMEVDAFGGRADGIRIRSKPPVVKKPILDESHKQWDAAVQSLRKGTTTLDKIRERFEVCRRSKRRTLNFAHNWSLCRQSETPLCATSSSHVQIVHSMVRCKICVLENVDIYAIRCMKLTTTLLAMVGNGAGLRKVTGMSEKFKRLTKRRSGTAVFANEAMQTKVCGGCFPPNHKCEGCLIDGVLDRLAAYEDSSLFPAHVQELAAAERENRLVVLPCQIGERVYRILDKWTPNLGCHSCCAGNGMSSACDYYDPDNDDDPCSNMREMYGDYQIISVHCSYEFIPGYGKTVFLTRAEAEAALTKMRGDNEQ